MPGITIDKYNPNDKEVNKIGDDERVQRQKYIAERWRYYDGNHDKPLKVKVGKRDNNILLNLCGRAVDQTVEFVGVPDDIEPEGEDIAHDGETETPLEAELDGLYKSTKQDLPEMIESGLIAGHSFIKLHLDIDSHAAMTLLDPQYVTVYWDAMNVKQMLFYRLQWKTGTKAYMQDIVPDWLINPPEDPEILVKPAPAYWMVFDYIQIQGSAEWRKVREQKHNYTFAPLVDWPYKRRPHSYYGTSFLHNAINLNDAINFVISNIGLIIEHHGHPKTFVFGFEVGEENAVGGIWDNLPTDGKVQNLEMQSDLSSSIKFFEMLRTEFFATLRVMDLSTIKEKLGQITNFGVRMMFNDMVEMTDELRGAIGMGLSDVYRRMLLMNNRKVEGALCTEWSDALPQNRTEILNAAKVEKDLGTTSQTTLTESIGRDPTKEAQLKAQEGTSSSTALVDTLEKVGQRGLFG